MSVINISERNCMVPLAKDRFTRRKAITLMINEKLTIKTEVTAVKNKIVLLLLRFNATNDMTQIILNVINNIERIGVIIEVNNPFSSNEEK
jgi:hypothetical protein